MVLSLLKGELLGDAILTWQTKSPKGLNFFSFIESAVLPIY